MNVLDTLETMFGEAPEGAAVIAAVRRLAEASNRWREISPFDDSLEAQEVDAALIAFGLPA